MMAAVWRWFVPERPSFYDRGLLALTFSLMGIGLMMVASASIKEGPGGDMFYFTKRHLIFLFVCLGIGVGIDEIGDTALGLTDENGVGSEHHQGDGAAGDGDKLRRERLGLELEHEILTMRDVRGGWPRRGTFVCGGLHHGGRGA